MKIANEMLDVAPGASLVKQHNIMTKITRTQCRIVYISIAQTFHLVFTNVSNQQLNINNANESI